MTSVYNDPAEIAVSIFLPCCTPMNEIIFNDLWKDFVGGRVRRRAELLKVIGIHRWLLIGQRSLAWEKVVTQQLGIGGTKMIIYLYITNRTIRIVMAV